MKNLLIFMTGAAIGSVVTWKLVEKKYKDLADEEIQSVVDTFKNRKPLEVKDEESKNKVEEKPKKSSGRKKKKEVTEIVEDNKYTTDDVTPDEESIKNTDIIKTKDYLGPMIISEEEFGTLDDWDTKSWMYWDDGVLTDEYDTPVDDPYKFLPHGVFDNLGEGKDECVYVRDEDLKTDYEILLSEKAYNE